MTNFYNFYSCISHKEHVVSIDEQHIILESFGFQSKLVIGDANSG